MLKAPARQGLATANNARFLRRPWEVNFDAAEEQSDGWVPYVKGAAGRQWFEPLDDVVNWSRNGTEVRNYVDGGRIASRPQNIDFYFRKGVAFTTIGASFRARIHRYPSIFGDMGQSVFPEDLAAALCAMNATAARPGGLAAARWQAHRGDRSAAGLARHALPPRLN